MRLNLVVAAILANASADTASHPGIASTTSATVFSYQTKTPIQTVFNNEFYGDEKQISGNNWDGDGDKEKKLIPKRSPRDFSGKPRVNGFIVHLTIFFLKIVF